MFDRKKFKEQAKEQLKGKKTRFAGFYFLGSVLLGAFSIFSATTINLVSDGFKDKPWIKPIIIIPVVFVSILCCFTVIGATKKLHVSFTAKGTLPEFKRYAGNYGAWQKYFATGIWKWFKIWLWSWLFVVPGIVKVFSYRMAFYIAAQFPAVGPKDAVKISRIICSGNKGELFKMELSFILWHILAWLTGGILYFWFLPYREQSFFNSYHYLLKNALLQNNISMEDLSGVKEINDEKK